MVEGASSVQRSCTTFASTQIFRVSRVSTARTASPSASASTTGAVLGGGSGRFFGDLGCFFGFVTFGVAAGAEGFLSGARLCSVIATLAAALAPRGFGFFIISGGYSSGLPA